MCNLQASPSLLMIYMNIYKYYKYFFVLFYHSAKIYWNQHETITE